MSRMIFNKGLQFEDEIIITESQIDFEIIDAKTVVDEKYKNCSHASHCMIYSPTDFPILNVFKSRAIILMQLRFDGHIGFPGGVVDAGENVEEALNRELSEEMDIPASVMMEIEDRKFIHYNKKRSLLLHFFIKQVSPELLRNIELRSTKALEYGNEVLGVLRVPLYTMGDGYRGFPAFLQNKFIGNAKYQLIESLKLLNIMSVEEIEKALNPERLHSPAIVENLPEDITG
ncbi:hypothetical protein O3M35_002377 [Rhynocoris fuscipes]|uniref:U8 snoRNA-decapping enzyme n=1 Tax=Rhynocoris fuscipes TaxID=488301 RepID=A0AAW1CL68_9HEMI